MVNGQAGRQVDRALLQEATMDSHSGTKRNRNRQRAEARAVAASARRQSALLGVVITVLMALLLVLWSQPARAAVGETAITYGQVEQSIEMAKSPRELFVGRWYGEEPEPGGITRRWVVEAFPDGLFRLTFRFSDAAGRYRETCRVGTWGSSGSPAAGSSKASRWRSGRARSSSAAGTAKSPSRAAVPGAGWSTPVPTACSASLSASTMPMAAIESRSRSASGASPARSISSRPRAGSMTARF